MPPFHTGADHWPQSTPYWWADCQAGTYAPEDSLSTKRAKGQTLDKGTDAGHINSALCLRMDGQIEVRKMKLTKSSIEAAVAYEYKNGG